MTISDALHHLSRYDTHAGSWHGVECYVSWFGAEPARRELPVEGRKGDTDENYTRRGAAYAEEWYGRYRPAWSVSVTVRGGAVWVCISGG